MESKKIKVSFTVEDTQYAAEIEMPLNPNMDQWGSALATFFAKSLEQSFEDFDIKEPSKIIT